MEYVASPTSFISLSTKKLLSLCRPHSDHWPQVDWTWWIITKMILANLVLLLVLLIIEAILFNCQNNQLGRGS